VPFLTPQELPEDDNCRPLSIPANSEWLALFGGALTELTLRWNWEYSGGLTVDETLAKMNEIINNWYTVPCAACTIPGGYRVIRITADGHIEELNESGDWQPGTDDYYIPPPESREGGEPTDQICLAAKNAVNVLNLLYESLSDSWSAELSVDDAVLAFIAVIVAAVGFAFAPIIWAVVIPLIAFFEVVYRLLEYLTADLWDEDFTDKLVCLFKDCASNDAGVVTFDFQCLQDGLNGLAITPVFTETQARLNIQLAYIINFIGGIDSLNLAGRTTAITDDNCDDCVWCIEYDFELTDGGFTLWASSPYGTWVSGTGWRGTSIGGNGTGLYIEKADDEYFILSAEIDFEVNSNTNGNGFLQAQSGAGNNNLILWSAKNNGSYTLSYAGNATTDNLRYAQGNGDSGVVGNNFTLKKLRLCGTGPKPSGGVDI